MAVSLSSFLTDLITHEGPIPLDHYMGLCVSHYYDTRDPLGADGDFITAPEISQIFGELIGLWVAQIWLDMGDPQHVQWVELGPGRGTLSADALRAVKSVPGFHDNLSVHLIETSRTLKAKQQENLKDYNVSWYTTLNEFLDKTPENPVFFIANEFFDALPVKQFIRKKHFWHERMIGLRGNDLVFGLSHEPARHISIEAPPGTILEQSPVSQHYAADIAEALQKRDGAALFIDYGYWGPLFGDTLQALKQHHPVSPLEEPGTVDLTAHVDFQVLAEQAVKNHVPVYGLATQRDFLKNLGIDLRAEMLMKQADDETKRTIETSIARLTESGSKGMGNLFKVLCFTSPSISGIPALNPL